MDHILNTVGRLHPLVVHLPIGMLLLAFILEMLSFFPDMKPFRKAVKPSLLFGAVFALFAIVTGLVLKEEGGYDDELLTLHQYFGIITAVAAGALYYVRANLKRFFPDSRKRRHAKIIMFVPLAILVSATGHWGGSLTHGESYLFPADDAGEDGIVKIEVDEPLQAKMYGDVIKPIFEAKCYDCHSSRKQKGKLRLDDPAYITRGGKNGEIILTPADSSMLYRALVLPIEDKRHMPPGEKPQLSSTEIDLIHAWLVAGSNFEVKVDQLAQAEKISQLIKSLQYTSKPAWVPKDDVGEAPEELLRQLRRSGASINLATADKHFLMINFTGVRNIASVDLTILPKLRDQIVWLDMGGHKLGKDHIEAITTLDNLRMLYLNNAHLQDEELTSIASLKELRYLNLTGNQITDITLGRLDEMKDLEQLYLYQTNVSAEAVSEMIKTRKALIIDTGGYSLPQLPTDTIVYKRKI
jgi:uncharacterized membrane protein